MKRLPALLPLAAAALAVSCSPRPTAPDFGERSVDTLLRHGAASCRVEYRFATIRNADASEALRTIEQANIGYFFELEEFSGTPAEAADSALHEIARECLPDLPERAEAPTYEIAVESQGTVVDTLLTYVIVRSSYLGGAHGSYATNYHNYSLRDGYELCTADLFTPEQLREIDRRIRLKLLEQYDATDDEGLAAAGLFPDYITATENFLVTPYGITFHYNPYEIGCYALGAVEVEFSTGELNEVRAR